MLTNISLSRRVLGAVKKLGDIDFQGRFIEVQRNFARGRFATPKGGESRRVDMSLELTQVLRDLLTDRQLDASAKNHPQPRRNLAGTLGRPARRNLRTYRQIEREGLG